MTIDQLQPYLSSIEARFAEARSLPADTLLLVIAACLLVILLLLNAWSKSGRRSRTLRRELSAMEAELASSRRVLEEEIKWRQSAERRGAQIPKPIDAQVNPLP
jgi:Tfp pilus assembly protein PilN